MHFILQAKDDPCVGIALTSSNIDLDLDQRD